jgi:hypothetical protein
MAFPVEKAIKTTIIGLLRTFGPSVVCRAILTKKRGFVRLKA